MCFSHPELAAWIDLEFEPVWESVRPVPLVTIDFGDGNVVHRTLHGNVATWVTDFRGRVIDVLPGTFQPEEYRTHLAALIPLARVAGPLDDRGFLAAVAHHHRIADTAVAPRDFDVDISKAVVERPLEATIAVALPASLGMNPAAPNSADHRRATLPAVVQTALLADSERNGSSRRRAIHDHLLAVGVTTVPDQTRWLYREVLHADLDDPWIGLGPVLFGADPFGDRSLAERPR